MVWILQKIEQIKLPLIKDYLKIVRSLAGQGRNYYQKYLIVPLSSWSRVTPSDELQDLMQDIAVFRKISDHEKLAPLYKKALIRSVAKDQFDLSIPGKLLLAYLRDMEENIDLANKLESVQLVNLLQKPFSDYSGIEYRSINSKFERDLSASESDPSLVAALERMQDEHEAKLKEEQKLSEKLIQGIRADFHKISESELKKEIISYIVKVASPNIPDLHRGVDPILLAMEKKLKGVKKEIYDSVAVIIYREIVNAIKSNDLKKALILISKYTVIFRGDPSTPWYNEVDAFERIFFSIIEKKNLWDSL